MEYAFDSKNNLSTLKEIINGITRETGYTYDADNRLQTVTGNGQTIEYTYDALGRLEKQEVKNGTEVVLTTTYTYYDPTSTTTSTQVESIQQTADNYSITYTYTYDGNGNILTISDGVNTYRYAYDELNQLTREDDPIAGISRVYGYRPGGALGLEFECPYTDGEVPMDQAKAFYSRDESWGDLFIGVNGMSASYDSIGNMLSFGEYLYHWEHGRELSAITDRDTMWAFTYDANGMRLRQWNIQGNDYYYVYNGSQLSQMTKNGQVLNFFYDGEGTPAYFTYGSATYYYVTNLQGDVIAILDSTGAVVVNYHYDAYGVLLQTGGTMAATLGALNPLTYRGYVYDHETGLYYLQSRYYNPAIRQFISPDAFVSTGQGYMGYNMFAYCGNNPVNRADPNGEGWITALIIVAVVVVSCAIVKGEIDEKIDNSGANDAEKALAKRDYIAAYHVNKAKTITEGYIEREYGRENDRDGTQVNAYRHAMWNAIMTDRIGAKKAKEFADAHEEFPGNPVEHMEMDLHNNELGRRIAIEYAGQGYDMFSQKIQEAIKNGEAKVIRWDPNVK